MNLTETTQKLFDKYYQELIDTGIWQRPAVLSYSGGKDSTLLLYLYSYLHQTQNIPAPFVFHLDHSIRNNSIQEQEIARFLQTFSFRSIIKKKIFLKFQSISGSL
jgi:tRNA(Ile)-lysidine synthase TilS/MesJ